MRLAICIVLSVVLSVLASSTAAPPPSATAHQRHKDFGQRAVHLFGAFDGWDLTRSDSYRQQIAVESSSLLKGYGQFPPTEWALANPKMIEAWQEAMHSYEKASPSVENSRSALVGALKVSGYPAGTAEFLELRGAAKLIRELDESRRRELRSELLDLLQRRREAFAAARSPLMPPAERAEFVSRLDKLHHDMAATIDLPGAIGAEVSDAQHAQFPWFHSLDRLELLQK